VAVASVTVSRVTVSSGVVVGGSAGLLLLPAATAAVAVTEVLRNAVVAVAMACVRAPDVVAEVVTGDRDACPLTTLVALRLMLLLGAIVVVVVVIVMRVRWQRQ